LPIALLGLAQVLKLTPLIRKQIYVLSGCLTLIGIFAMRWNVVIGGQLFSKSFLGYTTYKMGFATREGLLTAIALTILPFVFLWVLVKLLPPWPERNSGALPDVTPAHRRPSLRSCWLRSSCWHLALSWQWHAAAHPVGGELWRAVSTALALIVATHALVPLTSRSAGGGFGRGSCWPALEHGLSLRAVPALAADFCGVAAGVR
jgi:hypothetical protein